MNEGWDWTVERLGGEALLSASARESKAFVPARAIRLAMDLLRLTLAYCLGHIGLRATAAWAQAMGLAALSDVALLERLRHTGEWLSFLIGRLLTEGRPAAAHQGRSTVPQARTNGAANRWTRNVRERDRAPFGMGGGHEFKFDIGRINRQQHRSDRGLDASAFRRWPGAASATHRPAASAPR